MGQACSLTKRQMAARAAADKRAGAWLRTDHPRPRTRADCLDAPRPCPYVGCRYHLFLGVSPGGGLKLHHGEDPAALLEMADTCALDVADRGPVTLRAALRMLHLGKESGQRVTTMAYARVAQVPSVRELAATE